MFKDIYAENPSFVHRFKRLPFPDALAARLESNYILLLDCPCLSAYSIRDLESDSQQALSDIFTFWRHKADSDLQNSFLRDIHHEASDLISEDFKKFYLKAANSSRFTLSRDNLDQLASLRRDGYLISSFCHQYAIDIKDETSSLVDLFLQNESSGLLARDDLSSNNHPVIRNIARKINHIFRIQGINKIMSAYLGYSVEVTGLAIEMGSERSTWWQPVYPCSPHTMYIHRDETTYLPKAFIYLNHITKADGAFSVFPNADKIHGKPSALQNLIGRRIGAIGRSITHVTYGCFNHIYHQAFGDEQFRSLFMSLPEQARYSSHYGWDITDQDSVHNLLKADEVFLEGPPGSTLIFDGARISHRALQQSTNQHLSLQLIFGPTQSASRRLLDKFKRVLKTS